MIVIPGFVIAWLTFPGVIAHEAAHMLFCRFFRIAVLDAQFFRFAVAGPAGYVVHEKTDSFHASFFVGMGPFFVNSILCIVFCMAGFLPVVKLELSDPLGYLFYWLGFSFGMHAFPSDQDMSNVLDLARPLVKRLHPLAILSYPIAGIFWVADKLRIVWADAIYGALLGILLPHLLFEALA